ncbi:MAG TPA: hypothetical protein VGZ93_02660 [Candidatus Methylacidiphilales bacterium]|jgi:hypothetical protein|nr:hypothetical protein [Candidatus Methylacidiphilales bacterium]
METLAAHKKDEVMFSQHHPRPSGKEDNGCPSCGKPLWKICPREFAYCLLAAFLVGAVVAIATLKALHWLNTPTIHLSMPLNQI